MKSSPTNSFLSSLQKEVSRNPLSDGGTCLLGEWSIHQLGSEISPIPRTSLSKASQQTPENMLRIPSDAHSGDIFTIIRHVRGENSPEEGRLQFFRRMMENTIALQKEYLPVLPKETQRMIQEGIQILEQYPLLQEQKINPLSPEEREETETWLIGKALLEKRERINPSQNREEIRKRLIILFLNILQKPGYRKMEEEKERPWVVCLGPREQLRQRIWRCICQAMRFPDRELLLAFSRRGWENVVQEIQNRKSPLLSKSINIEALKAGLQAERDTGTPESVSQKEQQIARKVLSLLSLFPYEKNSDSPQAVLKKKHINCLGASLLGSTILEQIGIQVLLVNIPGHSFTLLITSNQKAFWLDFTPTLNHLRRNLTEITPKMVQNPEAFFAYIKTPTNGLLEQSSWIPGREGIATTLQIFPKHQGDLYQALNNMRCHLSEEEKHRAAVDASINALSINPDDIIVSPTGSYILHRAKQYNLAIQRSSKET